MIASTFSDASILERLVAPEKPTLSPEAAKEILALGFPVEDRRRMRKLAEKARRGTLTPAEQSEIESYERVGSFLGFLQSKARQSLQHAASDKR
jgi:hypothetical protein